MQFISKLVSGINDLLLHFFSGGPLVGVDFLRNKFNSWDINDFSKDLNGELRHSSLSDTPGYLQICRAAASDPSILNRFKSEIHYMRILEHVDYFEGKKYLKVISDKPTLIDNLKDVCSDEIGSPKKYYYFNLGRVSPTQLRYAKITGDLQEYFGSLDGLKIAEIGVGNGGQSLHILNMFKPKSYTYFDLPEVQELVKVILDSSQVTTPTYFPDVFNLEESAFDLVIANYSFSELRIQEQRNYLQAILLQAKRGYMIINDIKPNDWENISVTDLNSSLSGSKILAEQPETHPGNRLLIWGK